MDERAELDKQRTVARYWKAEAKRERERAEKLVEVLNRIQASITEALRK